MPPEGHRIVANGEVSEEGLGRQGGRARLGVPGTSSTEKRREAVPREIGEPPPPDGGGVRYSSNGTRVWEQGVTIDTDTTLHLPEHEGDSVAIKGQAVGIPLALLRGDSSPSISGQGALDTSRPLQVDVFRALRKL